MLNFTKHFVWTLPVAIATHDLICTVMRVDGPSMQPTLNPDTRLCDWVFVEKISYKWLHRYPAQQRGEVVVLKSPEHQHTMMIKRLVAVGGDTVWDDATSSSVEIPAGRCWIEGDNASRSEDSRRSYGPVHLGLLEGRATFILWPPSRAGWIKAVLPEDKLLCKTKEAT